MGKKLAIRGHSTRGEEVIELLVMMGGTNPFSNGMVIGSITTDYYYISENTATKYISWDYIGPDEINEYEIFTLEEFLEKYPYKVGDKVHIYVQNDDIDGRYDIEVAEITSMRWNPARCKIAYKMKDINREFYKEEIKCKVDGNHTQPSKMKNVLAELLEHIKTTPKEELEKEFKEIEEWSNVGPTVEEFMTFCDTVNKKPTYTYSKTYDECCELLGKTKAYQSVSGYKTELLEDFQKLLICRDAYWKIAGEEMGLGKPWKPNEDSIIAQYGIRPLLFPSKEIYNMFYDNFKDLIEQCKELL